MTKQGNFKTGDIVQLKSGGPEMTVQQAPASTGHYYKCQWFAGKKLESGMFATESLQTVEREAN
jgi:uncharacterized protein YodC (DUF2158 family)